MLCSNCGSEIPSAAQYCGECGKPVARDESDSTNVQFMPPVNQSSDPPTQTQPVETAQEAQRPAVPRKKLLPVLIGTMVLIIALLTAFITYKLELWGGVSMPDVERMTLSNAQIELAKVGIADIEIVYEMSEEPRDTVLKQSPTPGVRTGGDNVMLKVATPPVIPDDILSMSIEDARAALEALGLDVILSDYADRTPGKVTFCTPAPGSEVKSGEMVLLTVTRNPKVPELVGLDLDLAENHLWLEGLEAKIVYVDSDESRDTVVGVSPQEGTEVQWGDTIELSVSEGYGTQKHDFMGLIDMSGSEIDQALASRGFDVLWHTAGDNDTDNVVYSRFNGTGYEYVALGSGYPWMGMVLHNIDESNTSAPAASATYPTVFAVWLDEKPAATLEHIAQVMLDCGVRNLTDWFYNSDESQIVAIGKMSESVWTIGIDSLYEQVVFCVGPESVFLSAYGDDMWAFENGGKINVLSLLALGYY